MIGSRTRFSVEDKVIQACFVSAPPGDVALVEVLLIFFFCLIGLLALASFLIQLDESDVRPI
jgi:hypothetical protein